VELGKGEKRSLDIALDLVDLTGPSYCRVSGHVSRKKNGEAVHGATVKAISAFDPKRKFSTTTARDGYFELKLPAAQYLIFAYWPGFIIDVDGLVCQEGVDASINFEMELLR
jgi:hypothetical protein